MLNQERMEDTQGKQEADLSSVELKLPSKGVDYPASAQKAFQVRPPRVQEVEFLAGMNESNYDDQLTRLLRSLIVSPDTIDPIDLTLGDRQFLHVWVRAQIDSMYRFETTCPKCGDVNKSYELPIEKIPVIPVQNKYSPHMKLTLPKSKHTVAVRLKTARDRVLEGELIEKGFTKWLVKSATIITSVNGEQMDVEARCEWLRKCPAGTNLFMAQYLKWQRHGPDFSKCPFKCKEGKCRKESVLNMPFRLEFYIPTIYAAAAFEDAVRGRGNREDGGVSGDGGDSKDGVREVHVGEGTAQGTS